MSTKWASPRDEFPESVHALMSLWGGFDEPSGSDGAGLEKRLEIDFVMNSTDAAIAKSTKSTPFTAEEMADVMSCVEPNILSKSTDNGMLYLTCDSSILLATTTRIVITSSSAVPLHDVVRPLLQLLARRRITAEWGSFMRKNTVSPWDTDNELSDIMAQEYAALTSAFPSGNSLLTGPVDGDHFFTFVYDNIDRSDAARVDTDVQVNAIMYNVRHDEGEKLTQRCTAHSSEEYETLRLFNTSSHPCATYETNIADGSIEPRLAELLEKYTPDRFTLVVLLDPQSPLSTKRRFFEQFKGYEVGSRSVNCFTHGYTMHQLLLNKKM